MFSFVFSAITAAFTAHMEHQKKQHFIVIDDFSDCFNFSLVIFGMIYNITRKNATIMYP